MKRQAKPRGHRYELHTLYAFVWVQDTLQDGPVWCQQRPHEELHLAIAAACEFVRSLDGELFPPLIELMKSRPVTDEDEAEELAACVVG